MGSSVHQINIRVSFFGSRRQDGSICTVSHHTVDVADRELVIPAAGALLHEDVNHPDADALTLRRGEHPRAPHVARVVVGKPRRGYDLKDITCVF